MASSHYFDPAPGADSRRRRVTLALPDLTAELVTDTAVFSGDRVDPGTKYLLLDGPQPPADARHLADLGCGYGPIAVALAQRAPEATVWAVDVNERALELAAENLADYPNARIGGPPAAVAVDAIYSNPPIRIGKAGLRRLLDEWLPRLAPGGFAALVVHKHLGADSLAAWLASQGRDVRRLGSRLGYRILEVR